ncbi:MAG TPA: protein kinase [Chloroflexota bacterium]
MGESDRTDLIATRYELLAQVGSDELADLYRARDVRLGRIVALKLLRDEHATDPELVEGFQRQARIAAALSHPNVVVVNDFGSHDGTAFIVMEHVDGETLAQRLSRVGRLGPDAAVSVARRVLAGLAVAHAHGLVHRHVKPENVVLGRDGSVKLADFGMGLIATGAPTVATASAATYAAPELAAGGFTSPATDVYGVGLLLYEMVVGHPPFEGGTPAELVRRHADEPPRPPGELVEGVPPTLEALILRALAKEPAVRFGDAERMLRALDHLADAPAPPPPPAEPAAAAAPVPAVTAVVTPVPPDAVVAPVLPDAVAVPAPGDGVVAPVPPAEPGSALAPPSQPTATSPARRRLGVIALPLLAGLLVLVVVLWALPTWTAPPASAPATVGPGTVGTRAPAGATAAPAPTTTVAAPAAPTPPPATPIPAALQKPAPTASPGSAAAAPASAKAAPAPPTVAATLPAAAPLAAPSPRATPTAEPPRPTATATPEVFLLRLVDAGFRQQERTVAFGFTVENPDPSMGLQGVEYRVNAVGTGQAVLGGVTGRVPAMAGNQRLGVAGVFEVPAGATASTISVHLTPGRRGPSTSRVPLRTEGVVWGDVGTPRVLGVVVNPSGQASGPVALTALALDAGGRIVGAGAATAEPVPPNGRSSVEVPVVASAALAEVELYATSE